MGRELIKAVAEGEGVTLALASERPEVGLEGRDAGSVAGLEPLNAPVVSDLARHTDAFDVLIDFTTPDATMAHVRLCLEAGRGLVIGTTGLSAEQEAEIRAAGGTIPLVFAPNMSAGVNLCFKLVELAARALGDTVDVEVIEAHHRHKVDAPSGTSLRIGRILAQVLDRDLDECAVYGRQGRTGARDRRTIGFETIRAGDIVGEHTVLFAGDGERIEITHKATSRQAFARGAVRAAGWVAGQPPAVYGMEDVLGLG